jgi:uncharacterized protein DUF6600
MRYELLLLMLLGGAACAAAPADEVDPPGRAARLSDVEGSVSLEPAGTQDWTAATLNLPLTTGDRVWTDRNSRAELDLGAAVVRMGSTTGFAFLSLGDATAQMQLTGGTLMVRVRDMEADQVYEIDTPNLALSLQQPGDYRVEVSERGDVTVVKVSDGAAQAVGGGQTVAIGEQQEVVFSGTTQLTYAARNLGPPDELDGWSTAREQQVEDAASAEYLSSDVPGTQDLDNNGTWQEIPEYGYVWTPTTVAAGWVPYGRGRWVWVTPWGWTWVDAAPWGYAPFHYGRWVPCSSGWCWVPGPRRLRPVYAPALVAWVGIPGAEKAGAPGGNVGWFPLGPNEVYVAPYHVSPAYARLVNVNNTRLVSSTYINHIYEQTGTPHYVNNRAAAVTSVPQSVFVSGQQVSAHALQMAPALLAASRVTAAAPAIAPSRQSVLGPIQGRVVARPPAALLRRTVVAHHPPPRAPATFDEQLAAIQANGGRPLARAELAQLQPQTADASVRVVAIAGPVVTHAGAVAHPAEARAAAPAAGVPATSSFAERERILQHAQLSGPPPADTIAGKPRANAFVPPELPEPLASATPERNGHQATAQQPRTYGGDGATHAPGTPAALPVYHPPVRPDTGEPQAETHASAPAYRAPPSSSRPAAPAPQHAPSQPPPHSSSTRESRDSSAHGDRDSRERVVR